MISRKDTKWLKQALKDCFNDTGNQAPNTGKLEGFSMLVRNMVKNMKKELQEARGLLDKNPESKELKEKFDLLARRLSYLERYCREKIGRELKEEGKGE